MCNWYWVLDNQSFVITKKSLHFYITISLLLYILDLPNADCNWFTWLPSFDVIQSLHSSLTLMMTFAMMMMIYRIYISRNDCVCSIFKQLINTYYSFDILETSVLTKLNEWYRLQCTSWVRILFENHVFSISLHASFPFFRAVSQCINCIFSCINCVCCVVFYTL